MYFFLDAQWRIFVHGTNTGNSSLVLENILDTFTFMWHSYIITMQGYTDGSGAVATFQLLSRTKT